MFSSRSLGTPLDLFGQQTHTIPAVVVRSKSAGSRFLRLGQGGVPGQRDVHRMQGQAAYDGRGRQVAEVEVRGLAVQEEACVRA